MTSPSGAYILQWQNGGKALVDGIEAEYVPAGEGSSGNGIPTPLT